MLAGDARSLVDIVRHLFGGGGHEGGGGGGGRGGGGGSDGGGGVMGDDDGELRAMCEDIVGGLVRGPDSQPRHKCPRHSPHSILHNKVTRRLGLSGIEADSGPKTLPYPNCQRSERVDTRKSKTSIFGYVYCAPRSLFIGHKAQGLGLRV